jgi:hypothetical protein
VCGSERTARRGGGSTPGGSASVHLGRAIFPAFLRVRVAPAARGMVLLPTVTTAHARAAARRQPPLPAPQPAGLPVIGLSAAEGSGMLSCAATVYCSRLSAHRVARGRHDVVFVYTREAHPRGTADLF